MQVLVRSVLVMFFFSTLALCAKDKVEAVKIGPFFAIGNYKEFSGTWMNGAASPGLDLAIRCNRKVEIWGSYSFYKKEDPRAHGTYDIFRLDAFAAGLRYKLLKSGTFEPFAGIGLVLYHFTDDGGSKDGYTYFILPVNSAMGFYFQGGFYLDFIRNVKLQFFTKYNRVKHGEEHSSRWATYHYRTDFSGLAACLGIMYCILGK